MTTKNDITGDKIKSKPSTDLYRENWDQIFGWIPITEKLPEMGQVVRLKNISGQQFTGYRCSCCGSEWRCEITGSQLLIDVTHWRPL